MPIWFKISHSFGHNLKFSNEKCKVIIYTSRHRNGAQFGQGLPFAILSQIFKTFSNFGIKSQIDSHLRVENVWDSLPFQFFQIFGNVLGAFSKLTSHLLSCPNHDCEPKVKITTLGEIILYIFYKTCEINK